MERERKWERERDIHTYRQIEAILGRIDSGKIRKDVKVLFFTKVSM